MKKTVARLVAVLFVTFLKSGEGVQAVLDQGGLVPVEYRFINA